MSAVLHDFKEKGCGDVKGFKILATGNAEAFRDWVALLLLQGMRIQKRKIMNQHNIQ